MEFNTTLPKKYRYFNNISQFLGLPEGIDVFNEVECSIKWQLEFDEEDNGVYGYSIKILSISGTVHWEVQKEELTQEELNILGNAARWQDDDKAEGRKMFEVLPENCECSGLDFKNKQLLISDIDLSFGPNGLKAEILN